MAKRNLLAQAEAQANAGRVNEAADICRSILKKTPNHIEATFLLSGILMLEKKFKESEPLLRKVLAQNPNHVSAMNNLGVVYREYYKDLQKAETLFKKVIEANPGHFRALMNLGNIYCDQNRDDLGAACYQQALSVNPGAQESASFHAYLGNICYRKKEFDQAIAHFEAGLQLSPDNTDILRNFILARLGKGNKAELMTMIKEVLKLPDAGRAYFPIFSIAKRNCFWDIADQCAPKVLELIQNGCADFSAMEMSNLDLLAVPGIPYETLLDVHRITGQMLEGKRMRPPFDTHEKAVRETTRLRIGYLSGDFRGHVVNTFIRGLFNFHDREFFEIYCYSNTAGEDATTEQYKKTADAFVNITGMTDAEAAEKIHADGVHILINLAGYTHGSRMEVLSYKPAPVQMMYLGYPYTSGLSTVDYIISDPCLDGPENAKYFVEKQLRLPECFVTFDSLLEQEIAPDPPFKQKGHVTFGCLVNPYKLTAEAVKVWSRILSAIPGSRLILNNPHYDFDQMRARIREAFASEGIDSSRVDMIWERHASGVHLRYYNDIDIALDTFPLTGGTTTHEALWMGVPVVTYVGDLYPYRISYSLLSNAGMDLSELIAFSADEYIEKAVALAKNPARIETLHRAIPIHLKESIQCDPVRHTNQMEAAYLEAWNKKFPDQEIQFEAAEDTGETPVEALFAKAVAAAKDSHFNASKALCRKIFKHDPEHIDTLALLGSVHLMEKNYASAKTCLDLVLSVCPRHVNALNNLGLVHFEESQDFETATRYFHQALEMEPNHINSLMNLGNVSRSLHDLEKAENYYKGALARDPGNGHLLNNLGSLHAKNGRFSEARAYYQKALACFPDTPEILSNLMTMHRAMGEHAAALTLVPRVMNLYRPGAAIFPVYNCAKMFCFWEEAADLLPKIDQCLHAGQATLDAFVEFNLALLATPGIRPEIHFEVHQKAARLIDQHRAAPAYSDYSAAMRRTGRLKVGYLSPDFHRHVSNICFRGLMNFHDKDLFEVTCYSNSNIEDEISAQYRAAADHFVNVSGMSDQALAERIHADGVHFLIDLAGYTTNGRMGVLSYRPAPVQMMYLGYPYTSGSPSVDYFIADPYLNGPENAKYFSERMLCLPESFISFSGFRDQPIDPVSPYEKNGYITFGSMNNLYKLNPELIAVWSRILARTPGSKMIINHPNCSEAETRRRIKAVFQTEGIHPERIEIIWEKHPTGSHFYYYNAIDIILDSFPMTGGTTTIDAAWMGVPVITKAGGIYPHRLSYSILKNIGIDVEALIATSDEDYIAKAVALAKQPRRIAALRREIPAALSQSILTDPLRLTRQMEAAYLKGWNKKYPDQAISQKIRDQKVRYIPIAGDVEIAVRDAVDDLETYVLSEQKGWFDPEYDFIQKLIQAGGHVLDIGAGIGSYAVPLARKVGPEGRVFAVTASATDAQYLHYSKARNALAQLDVITEAQEQIDLDREKACRALSSPDFIRIGAAEPVRGLLVRGAAFFRENAPLVMFRIKGQEDVIQTEAQADFKALGYDIYRFVPGLDALIPFSSQDDLDTFALNLFACKAERAEVLEKQGVLIQKIVPLSQLPGLEAEFWRGYLAPFPYAEALTAHWLNDASKWEAWENYWIALNLYAEAKETRRSAGARYAALNAAFGLLVMLAETAVNLPRILTLIRVMTDLGKRETAVHFLNQVVSLFESGDPVEINEPFVPLSDEDAAVNPEDRFGEWLFASVLKQREQSRAFSSYFSGEASLPILEAVRETPFYSEETDRRLALIRLRFPGSHEEKVTPNRVSAC